MEVNGTCAFVDSTINIEYFTRKKLAKTLGDDKFQVIFATMVNLGFGSGNFHNKATSKNKNSSGISPKNLAPLLTKYYKMHKKNLKGV